MGLISERKWKIEADKHFNELKERVDRLEKFIEELKKPRPNEPLENKIKEEVNKVEEKAKEEPKKLEEKIKEEIKK